MAEAHAHDAASLAAATHGPLISYFKTALWVTETAGWAAAYATAARDHSAEWPLSQAATEAKANEHSVQTALLRDIVGNPFRPPPALLTPDIVGLARAMYDSRDFGRTAELADALEAAGCTDAALLAHLRSPGPHVRGCFALDAVLGKS
jgi:hypothetical protein